MTEPIVVDLAAAQEAQNRLDDGMFTDEDKPRLVELAALYEGYCQQEYGRFLEEAERAERARWLVRQCGGCVDGGTGELCDEHWEAQHPVAVADRVCTSREELEAAADQRLAEENAGITDHWRES